MVPWSRSCWLTWHPSLDSSDSSTADSFNFVHHEETRPFTHALLQRAYHRLCRHDLRTLSPTWPRQRGKLCNSNFQNVSFY